MPRYLALVLLALASCVAVHVKVNSNPAAECAEGQCVLAPPPVRTLHLGAVGMLESMEFMADLEKVLEEKPPMVTVVIDSPGGSVGTMLEIIDNLRQAQTNGTNVRCVVDGMAASAAAVILEAGCSERTMTRGSQLMFHSAATSLYGKSGDFRKVADHLEDLDRRIATLIAWRMGMTADEYLAWVDGRDRWEDFAGALTKGFIDSVAE